MTSHLVVAAVIGSALAALALTALAFVVRCAIRWSRVRQMPVWEVLGLSFLICGALWLVMAVFVVFLPTPR